MVKNILLGLLIFLIGNNITAQNKNIKVEQQKQEIKIEGSGLKRKVAIARFSNETTYAKGIFYNKDNDPVGKQGVDILSTKLAASNKFILLEREGLDKILSEVNYAGNDAFQKVGADYVIIGSITEFGRKNVGGQGVFSRSKTQTVYAGVSVRLIDVSTGQIIYSEEAKGEAETTSKTTLGLGKEADYDQTLSDKAISVAISKLVENIIKNCMNNPWKSYFLTNDENGILISGGKSQGLKIGEIFEVVQKGKAIKNPQNGMMMELPGKTIGKIKIDFIGGDNPQNEYSIVTFIDGALNSKNLTDYYIKEIKS